MQPTEAAAEESASGVLRGVQLEPAPESPFASAARGGGSPPQPGSPSNSLSSSRAVSTEQSGLQAALDGAPPAEAAAGAALTDAADAGADAPPKKPKAPQNRTVSWNVALSTVREYEAASLASPQAAPALEAPPPPGSSALLLALRDSPVIFRELIAGGVSGATAKSSVAPLERCKILFQTGKLHAAGIGPTLRAIVRSDGARGLFRGNGASVLRIVPYSSVHLGLYEHYRRRLVDVVYGPGDAHRRVSPLVDLASGAGAGATAVMVTYPLDLVRTRLAYITEAGELDVRPKGAAAPPPPPRPRPQLPPNPAHTIRGVLGATLRRDGVRGLYHGLGPAMYGILPYAGLKFYVYQHLKQAYLGVYGAAAVVGGRGDAAAPAARLPVPAMLACGAAAGLVAQTATYPLDVVRRRMQVEGLRLQEPAVALGPPHFPDERLPRATPAALVAIARRQGWRVLFSGLSINYMKVVPSTAIGFTLYDSLKAALDLPTHL